MADISQVEQALVEAVAAAAYPAGTGQPSAVAAPVKVYRGWPDPDTLNRDLAAGGCHVTIYSRPGVLNTETRAFARWDEAGRPDPTMTATVDAAAQRVTFAGDASGPLMIAVVATGPDQVFTVAIGPGDDAASVAQRFAQDIGTVREAWSEGAVLGVPGATTLRAGTVAGGTARRTLRDQRQGISVTLWCAGPTQRDVLAPLVDQALMDQPRLALPDGTTARLTYQGTASDDGARGAPTYRRDLLLMADFSTTVSRAMAPVVALPVGPDPDRPEPAPGAPVTDVPIRAVVVTVN